MVGLLLCSLIIYRFVMLPKRCFIACAAYKAITGRRYHLGRNKEVFDAEVLAKLLGTSLHRSPLGERASLHPPHQLHRCHRASADRRLRSGPGPWRSGLQPIRRPAGTGPLREVSAPPAPTQHQKGVGRTVLPVSIRPRSDWAVSAQDMIHKIDSDRCWR